MSAATPANSDATAGAAVAPGASAESGAAAGSGGGVIAIIRELQSGAVAGRNLAVEDRRRCVEHLTAEGYSVAEVAEILGVAERTIARDRAAVREANALKAGPQFAGEMAGQLLRQAEAGVARLRRLSRERDCPHATRVDAERAAWLVTRELVQTLQRLGFLPEAPREIRASLHHQVDGGEVGAPSFDDLLIELDQLEAFCRDARPEDNGVLARLAEARRAVAGYSLSHSIALISADVSADRPEKDVPPRKENDP